MVVSPKAVYHIARQLQSLAAVEREGASLASLSLSERRNTGDAGS